MLILKNCRLVPELTEGFGGQAADIAIDGKTIKEIAPAGKLNAPDAEVLDIKGKTVLPGFFDLHAHLMFTHQDYNALMLRPQNRYVLDCMKYAESYLRLGYTTVRDCGNDYYASVSARDAVAEGLIQGARVITSGKIVTPTTRGNSSFGSLYLEVDDPAEMRGVCRREMAQGVDFIKYMVTGAVLNEGGSPGQIVTTPEEIRAMTGAADSLGTYIAAHCHGTEGIKQAILNGVHTIEHATYMDEECVELILKQGNTTATIPTFSICYTIIHESYSGGVMAEYVAKGRDAIGHMAKSVEMSEKAGVLVGWGTDLDRQMAEKFPGLEFTARSEMGLPNITILREATINCAKILGMDDMLGTVKAGKYADLVVIDGKPDEDMNAMKQVPTYVFKEGKRCTI
jgi:imidazolonepropionase-like amidohydrolase